MLKKKVHWCIFNLLACSILLGMSHCSESNPATSQSDGPGTISDGGNIITDDSGNIVTGDGNTPLDGQNIIPGDGEITDPFKTDMKQRELPEVKLPPDICVKSCFETEMFLCVTPDPNKPEACAECTEDKHCTGNPGAYGPKCDTTSYSCFCETNQDCTNNYRGVMCDYGMCVCRTDLECSSTLPICSAGSTRVCTQKCTSDDECKKWYPGGDILYCLTSVGRCSYCKEDSHCTSSQNHCNPYTGACANCASNDHCRNANPFCDVLQGYCFECVDSKDCALSPGGSVCLVTSTGTHTMRQCTCDSDNDCKGIYARGAKCITRTPNTCGCEDDNDCKTSSHGPICNKTSKVCGCEKDEDCKTDPYKKCVRTSLYSSFKDCRKPCQSDKDCSDSSLPFCNTIAGSPTNGQCLPCLKDEDCKKVSKTTCDLTTGDCQ